MLPDNNDSDGRDHEHHHKTSARSSSVNEDVCAQERRHADAASLVGRAVQVQYPSLGTLKGLVTGYYRHATMFRVDFLPNGARLKSDIGTFAEERFFHSDKRDCICPTRLKEMITDSSSAAKYFRPRLVQIPNFPGKIGYMLGKIVKSDWGNDGVFLGMLVNYEAGNKFQVVYADGDDEWGVFEDSFKSFALEDGGRRSVGWFDMDPLECLAAGDRQVKERQAGTRDEQPQGERANVEMEEEMDNAISTLVDEVFEKWTTEEEPEVKTPRLGGAFTASFLESSGLAPVQSDTTREWTPEPATKTLLKQRSYSTGSKPRPKKAMKLDTPAGPKRIRSGSNGNVEHQPAAKKLRNATQEKEKTTKEGEQRTLWLSDQTTTPCDRPSSVAAEPEGPKKSAEREKPPKGLSAEKESSSMPHTPASKKKKVAPFSAGPMHKQQRLTRSSISPQPPNDKPHQEISPAQTQLLGATPGAATAAAAVNIQSTSQDKQPVAVAPSKRHLPEGEKEHRLSGGSGSRSYNVTSPISTSPSLRRSMTYSSVEIGLEMQTMENHLDNLTQSRERIAKATEVAISVARCGGAKRVIDAVLVQIKEPVGAERKVALFYLLDSILQHASRDKQKFAEGRSNGEAIIFLELVESRLNELVETLSDEYDSYTKLEKVLELWKERHFFAVETMDKALEWLYARSDKHARFIEDDKLRSKGFTPYYVRSSRAPRCHRVILRKVFASVGRLKEQMAVPEALMHQEMETYQKSEWDEIDSEIKSTFKSKGCSSRSRFGPVVAVDGRNSVAPLEEGEIPMHPPLPPDSPPPEDIEDQSFVPPLPSDSPPDDPNFVPPLPSSPPPASTPRFGNDTSFDATYRRHDRDGRFPRYHPPMYNERSMRSEHHLDYRQPNRGTVMDPRLHQPPHRVPMERDFNEKDWYGKQQHYPGRFRNDVYPQEYAAPFVAYQPPVNHEPMHRLPQPLGGTAFPYPPPQWTHARPTHQEAYRPVRSHPSRQW